MLSLLLVMLATLVDGSAYWTNFILTSNHGLSNLHRRALSPTAADAVSRLRSVSNQLSNALTLRFACELAIKHRSWSRDKEVLRVHLLGVKTGAEISEEEALLAELKQAQPQLQTIHLLMVGLDLADGEIGSTRHHISGITCNVRRVRRAWHVHMREHVTDEARPDLVVAFNSGLHSGSGSMNGKDAGSWMQTLWLLTQMELFSVFTSLHHLEWVADVEAVAEQQGHVVEQGINPWQSLLEKEHQFPAGSLAIAFGNVPVSTDTATGADVLIASRNRYYVAFRGQLKFETQGAAEHTKHTDDGL